MRLPRALSYGIQPRIYIILRGGLGNQLHQIAAGVKLAEESNGKVIIFPHIVDNAENPERRGFFRDINLSALFPNAKIAEVDFLEMLVLRAFNSKNFRFASKLVIRDDNFFNHTSFPIKILRGWFQSFDYIPSEINFASLRSATDKRLNEVTFHVRLTDFLSIDLNPLNSSYYKNALTEIRNRVEVKSFRCFSDDINGAENLLPEGVSYDFPEIRVRYSAPTLLAEMANSTSLVCSKSSLCWWAANSVTAVGGIVISPWESSTHNQAWIKIFF